MSEVLLADQIAFTYPQNNLGLAPVSLSVNAGEGIFISGNSGSGKSTFTRCLSGLIPHLYRGEFSGKVLLNGQATVDLLMWKTHNGWGWSFRTRLIRCWHQPWKLKSCLA